MATSTKQTVATVEVYDYLLNSGDATLTIAPGLGGKRVKVTLAYDKARTINPVTWLENQTVYAAITDPNGFWHVFVPPTDNITPANTYYIVEVEGYLSYKINPTQAGVPAIGWQSSAILLDIPASLTPAGQTITGPLTVTGTLAVTGLLTVVSTTGMQVDAVGNISGRSLSLSATAPYIGDFPAGATNILTDGTSAKLYDKGGVKIDVNGPKYRAIGTWDPIAGTGDCGAAIIQALADLPTGGGEIHFGPGTYRRTADVTIPADNITISTAGKSSVFLAAGTGFSMFKALNRQYLTIGDMFLDGAWQSGVTGINFDGVLYSRIGRIWGDRFLGDTQIAAPIVFQCTASASQVCGRIVVDALSTNGGRALVFMGRSAFAAPNIYVKYVYAQGIGNAVSTLIDWVSYSDSCVIGYADLGINFTGSTAVKMNSGVPGSPNGVNENHILKCMITPNSGGQNSIIVNNTESFNYVGLRLGGTSPAMPQINAGGRLSYLPGSRDNLGVELGTFGDAGAKLALYGVAPVARAGAIAAPTAPSAGYVQAEAQAMKTAVDAIRVALQNLGITL
jgi:hypothetical protein